MHILRGKHKNHNLVSLFLGAKITLDIYTNYSLKYSQLKNMQSFRKLLKDLSNLQHDNEMNEEFESQIGPKGPKGVVEDVEFVMTEQKKLSEVSHVWLLVIDGSLRLIEYAFNV